MYSKEVVIAAWDKDYNLWSVNLLPNIKVTVYNKNKNTIKNNEIFISPNVGRCVHTFFNHIVERYDCLADITFFSQDYFADHISNYVEIMNGDEEMWNNFAIIKNNGCWFFNTQYDGLLKCDKHGNPSHPGLQIEKIWDMLFNIPIPQSIIFSPAGHLCISKKEIHKKPKEFYKKIVNILQTDSESPWIIERLELYIFLENILETEIYNRYGINDCKKWPNCIDYLKL